MPRRREVPKRKIFPDPKYGDRMVGRFTNVIMRDGKKSTSERAVYDAFRNGLFTAHHHVVDEFGYVLTVVFRIGKNFPFCNDSTSRHVVSFASG